MDFGKKVINESYFNGKSVNRTVTYSVPIKVQTQAQALNEIMKALDVISAKKTDEVTLRIEAAKGGGIRMITKSYTVPE